MGCDTQRNGEWERGEKNRERTDGGGVWSEVIIVVKFFYTVKKSMC